NKLQFSWANTLIDPTSLEMLPKTHADKIEIANLTYPPRVKNLGLWNINSEVSGKVPVEITYLTSGLSWRAFYMGTLTEDEKTMRLQGYVVVSNNSGEEYENAQTRLIVGKVHLLDEIARLAQRQYPYERPGIRTDSGSRRSSGSRNGRDKYVMDSEDGGEITAWFYGRETLGRKVVKKEGLSEYFLYTIEGTETIANGWSKRLGSFDIEDVPVSHLYKYDEERFRRGVVRFLSFANDDDHELGETPIPGGLLKVYKNVDDQRHLAYTGQSAFKYIPVNEDVELNLGAVSDVVVEPKLMEYKTANYRFDGRRNVSGWNETAKWKIEVRNTRDLDVEIEITRGFGTNYWKIATDEQGFTYEKYDASHGRFEMKLPPRTNRTIEYTLTKYHGTREEAVAK
ncbi:MAG: DUF4139 domain-containing protein, partial [Planctomycetes bacterium]|nr:DUF4139 domain-containing protein [Planctomycetota bacterium]